MYLLWLFQLIVQITFVCCETDSGRSIQNKKIFTSNSKLQSADKIDLSVQINQLDKNNINERDTADAHSRTLHFRDHHGIQNLQIIPTGLNGHPNKENTIINNDYNEENKECISFKEYNPKKHHAMVVEEKNLRLPRYSVLRKNKQVIKDNQVNLENIPRKLYVRSQEPKYNEEVIVTGEACVDYKGSSSSSAEQDTTDITATAYTIEGDNTISTTTSSGNRKLVGIKNGQQNNRTERETKDINKNSMLHFKDRHEMPIKQRLSRVFQERRNIENARNYNYNYDNEDSPSLIRENTNNGFPLKNAEDRRPRYSGLRRNKSSLKDHQVSSENESRKLYARKAHEPRYNEEIIVTGESCVELKPDSSLKSTTELAATDSTYTTSRDNSKTKITRKGNHKASSSGNGNEMKLLENEELNEYDKYLCGLFADDFVNAILAKVRRSRKMAKELGFSNESDENCDRCIELKPSKIPDLDSMRESLGTCSKASYSNNNTICENSMSDFLDLLLLYEVEHENSVYNKIRDDSSFIFTGDYDSSIRKENGLEVNEKDHNRDSFSKDSFERQHLRDENTEEKSDDRVSHINYSPGKVKSFLDPSSKSNVEENEDDEIEEHTIRLLTSNKYDNKKDDAERKNFIKPETSFDDKDFSELQEQDLLSPEVKIKYPTNKNENNKEFDGPQYSADTVSDYLNKPDKVRTSKDIHSSFREPTYNYGRDVHKHKERQDDPSPYSKLDQYAGSYGVNQARSDYGNHRPRGSEFIKSHGKHNKQREIAGNIHNRRNNYLSYFPGGYETSGVNEDSKLYSPYDKLNNWDESEYQLYPNQPKNGLEDPLKVRVLPESKYYRDGVDNSLRMVKRDAEPYDEDLSGFEIPDIEYELY